MPLTRICAPKHLPCPKVRALADAAQDDLVQTSQVPANDLFQLISRFDVEEMILDRSFGGVSRLDDACIVEVTFLQGRSDDQKRSLFRQLVERATEAGFRPNDIVIALTENARADWTLGMGIAMRTTSTLRSSAIADMSLCGYLYYPTVEAGIDIAEQYPAVFSWLERLKALAGWKILPTPSVPQRV